MYHIIAFAFRFGSLPPSLQIQRLEDGTLMLKCVPVALPEDSILASGYSSMAARLWPSCSIKTYQVRRAGVSEVPGQMSQGAADAEIVLQALKACDAKLPKPVTAGVKGVLNRALGHGIAAGQAGPDTWWGLRARLSRFHAGGVRPAAGGQVSDFPNPDRGPHRGPAQRLRCSSSRRPSGSASSVKTAKVWMNLGKFTLFV